MSNSSSQGENGLNGLKVKVKLAPRMRGLNTDFMVDEIKLLQLMLDGIKGEPRLNL